MILLYNRLLYKRFLLYYVSWSSLTDLIEVAKNFHKFVSCMEPNSQGFLATAEACFSLTPREPRVQTWHPPSPDLSTPSRTGWRSCFWKPIRVVNHFVYRATQHLDSYILLTSNWKLRGPVWAVVSYSNGPPAGGTFVLMSTEYRNQGTVSPCRLGANRAL